MKAQDSEREENTVRESLAELQKQLGDDDELGGATVLQPARPPTPVPAARPTPVPPARPTPIPQRTTPPPFDAAAAPQRTTPPPFAAVTPPPNAAPMRASAPVMAPPVRAATPPYGMAVARGTPLHEAPPVASGFDETVLGVGDENQPPAEDGFPYEGATQVASADYDQQAPQAMMFANTPPPYAPPPPYGQPMRPSMRMPTPVPPAEPPMDNADLQARLARLQGLSLERPAPAIPSSAMSSSSSWGSKLPWILLVLVVVGGGFYHVRALRAAEERAAKAAPAAAAASATPSTPSTPSSLLAQGYIAAKAPITLSATTSGRLSEVEVDAGDTITKGQILAQISDGNIRAELSLAAARVRDAGRQHQRTAMLVKAQAATRADLEKAVGAVEVARAEMRVIEQKLEETKIRSPINGTVLEVLARPGEALTAGPSQSAAVMRIADLSALIAEVDVAEAELKNVFVGQEAEVTTEAQRGKTFKGVVREIAEQADRARGTVLVKVDILPEETPADAEPKSDAKPEPKPDQKPKKGDKRKKGAPAAETPATVKTTSLRPGMAVQVRFIAKSS